MKRFFWIIIWCVTAPIAGTAVASTDIDMQAGFKRKEYNLANSPGSSCLAKMQELPADLNGLTVNLGDMAVVWNPPSNQSYLRILFVEFKMSGDHLYGKYVHQVIAGDELNCIFGDKNKDSVIHSHQIKIKTPGEFSLGNLRPADPSLKDSFEVLVQYRVFGIIFSANQENRPVEYQGEMSFNFQAAK